MTHLLASLSKSISARVEGRNSAALIILAFCAFIAWIVVAKIDVDPIFSWIFLSIIFIMAIAVMAALLLMKPHPSEVSEKSLLVRRDAVWARGFQSSDEITAFLREAHHIRDLPPPAGVVHGKASNPDDYRDLSVADAARMADADRDNVNALLKEEIERITSSAAGISIDSSKMRAEIREKTED